MTCRVKRYAAQTRSDKGRNRDPQPREERKLPCGRRWTKRDDNVFYLAVGTGPDERVLHPKFQDDEW